MEMDSGDTITFLVSDGSVIMHKLARMTHDKT